MENYTSVFIGIVDILGYSNLEHHLDQENKGVASHFITNLFSSLDQQVDLFNQEKNIHWVRYGDGYVFYSQNNDMRCLIKMVKDSSRLIALSLTNTIPLRIAITQGNLKLNKPKSTGLTITGSGWLALQKLEKSLDWMGGVLYLPSYDGHHYKEINKLVESTHLIIQQEILSSPEHCFIAPFKDKSTCNKDRVWFINWHKILHQRDEDLTQSIKIWWHNFNLQHVPISDEVIKKQENTLKFATYCNLLYKSSRLIYFSKIAPSIRIDEIM